MDQKNTQDDGLKKDATKLQLLTDLNAHNPVLLGALTVLLMMQGVIWYAGLPVSLGGQSAEAPRRWIVVTTEG